jgi:prophage DNA circulation protein
MNGPFDAALPSPYANDWKRAERPGTEDSPRLTSYQAPGGKAVVFILKSFTFSGGQSVDTSEYPFDGLWSNEALNEKPQTLRVEGCIRGAEYVKTRNAFIEALRVKTSDDAPGFIDFPFWGRFPVVVIDYEIAENTDEKGQCAVSLTFKRAGVSITGMKKRNRRWKTCT